jgi:hypothetical protein
MKLPVPGSKFQVPSIQFAGASEGAGDASGRVRKSCWGLEVWSFCGACCLALDACMLLAANGCSKKPDVKAQTTALEQAFGQPQTLGPTQGADNAPRPEAPAAEANAYVAVALAAVRSNDEASAVIALQMARQKTGATAAQLMAVQRAMDAITADLVARAGRGDLRAQEDLAAIEKSRSQ